MYALRRLVQLPLSLLLLSFVCFGLRSCTYDDLVEASLPPLENRAVDEDPAAYDRTYRRAAASLGIDLPTFYLSLQNAALPDTLERIVRPGERNMVRSLTLESGNWSAVEAYYRSLRSFAYSESTVARSRQVTLSLLNQVNKRRTATLIDELRQDPDASEVVRAYDSYLRSKRAGALLLPALRWHGRNNQYHRWVTGLFTGRFGTSTYDRQAVVDKIASALPWTLLLNGLALLVVFTVSIPLGLFLGRTAGRRRERWVSIGLFLLYGIPSFWAATLLANFFTTPAYGMDLFPSMGVGKVAEGASWLTVVGVRAAHLFLPVLCLAYPGWAYVSRHLRNTSIGELRKGYVRLARMKSLSIRKVLWHHVFRNASFPLITLLGSIFPGLLAGSILIEQIFNIPGMGRLLYQSIQREDWPVIIILVLLNGVLTAVGLMVADVVYSWVDPRVELRRPSPKQPILL